MPPLLSRHQTIAVALTALVAATMILTPPQIRPSASNSAPSPSSDRLKSVLLSEKGASSSGKSPHAPVQSTPADIDLFVVFHERLYDAMYSDLRVPDAHIDVALTHGENASTIDDNHGVTFLATNPDIRPKMVNTSNPLYKHRMINEWEMPGYDGHINAGFHDYGAMLSVYLSNWTGAFLPGENPRSPRQQPRTNGVVAQQRNKGDTAAAERKFVGFLQYDMKIGSSLLHAIHFHIADERDARHRRKGDSAEYANWVKFSPRHRSAMHECCVFYAVSFPMVYLLDNPAGRYALARYNAFHTTKLTPADLHPVGVLDGFVVPQHLFNRIMPFLADVMHDISRTPRAGEPRMETMEKALAVALAANRRMQFVQIPVRHERLA